MKAKNRWFTWLQKCLKRVERKCTQATDKLSACLPVNKWDCLITEEPSNTSARCVDQEAGRNVCCWLLGVSKEQKQVAESSALFLLAALPMKIRNVLLHSSFSNPYWQNYKIIRYYPVLFSCIYLSWLNPWTDEILIF